jgi:UDP-N-acetylmuramate dehydrogenase
VPLAPFTTLGVGGDARWFATAETIDDIAAAQDWCGEQGTAPFVIGGGSNVVIADEGFEGLVLHVDLRGVEYGVDGGDTLLRVGAGESWDDLVARPCRHRVFVWNTGQRGRDAHPERRGVRPGGREHD